MVPRSSLIIRSLAGAYITYLGGKLLVDSLKDHPNNYVFYAGAGVVFVIIGIFWLGKYGSKLIKKEYQDDSVMGQLKDKEEQSEEAETEEAETKEGEEYMRVGMGYDVHKLVDGRDLILGGVKIPYEKGLLGHSDADVLLHAVMDALLGAAALGDIGKHFPDTDPAYEGASSIKLLEEVGKLIDEKLYVIGNIDATIIAQRPKMAPHIEQMRKNVAEALHIEVEQVNIKATTEEGLGFTGTGEGISSQAIASLDTIANYSYRVGPAEGGCAGCGGCMKAQDR